MQSMHGKVTQPNNRKKINQTVHHNWKTDFASTNPSPVNLCM